MTPSLRLLSHDERLAAWKFGAAVKLASMGISLDRVDTLIPKASDAAEKQAGLGSFVTPLGTAKSVAAIALLTGIPLGIIAHAFSRRTNATRAKERDLATQRDYYGTAADQLNANLQASKEPQFKMRGT